VISWRTILGDESMVLGPLKQLDLLPEDFRLLATPLAVVTGIAYNFLPFMTLPIYVSLEKIDRRLLEAGEDLYASPAMTFLKVTLPLALPGVFAGTLLTFIPAMGDFINAEMLGQTPDTRMIGNVIQSRFLMNNDFPTAAALSFILMAGILVAVAVYARLLGTEELTSSRS
jgi:spermidine/putrescine transport system permease protein